MPVELPYPIPSSPNPTNLLCSQTVRSHKFRMFSGPPPQQQLICDYSPVAGGGRASLHTQWQSCAHICSQCVLDCRQLVYRNRGHRLTGHQPHHPKPTHPNPLKYDQASQPNRTERNHFHLCCAAHVSSVFITHRTPVFAAGVRVCFACNGIPSVPARTPLTPSPEHDGGWLVGAQFILPGS